MNIQHAVEVASLLRHNIVQGVRDTDKEDDRWRTFNHKHKGKRSVANENGIVGLRIHDGIERGDNDSVKIGGKDVKVDKPCSS